MSDENNSEKQSSIEVARNAKGQFTFKVKTYYDEDFRTPDSVVEQNSEIMRKLLKEFS